ncbi:MAG TPA: hypothetical protein VFV93_15275 [Thermomicrobiales bacterium]|nr:hypothetical protein [Thermomicrobiales bacterium]
MLKATYEQTRKSKQQMGWRRFVAGLRLSTILPTLASAAVVLVLAALAVGLIVNRPGLIGLGPTALPAPTSTHTPTPDPWAAFIGTFVADPGDFDNGLQTMTVVRSDTSTLDIVVTDTIASVCELRPSTMTGIGHVQEQARLVIPTPDYRCDDGTTPHLINGDPTPLNDALRNLTYRLDWTTGNLIAGQTEVWVRQPDSTQAPTESPSPTLAPTAPPSATPVATLAPTPGTTPEVSLEPGPVVVSTLPRQDGEFITFDLQGAGSDWNLAAQDPATGNVRVIVDTTDLVDCADSDTCANIIRKAEWSADGRWVAFEVSNADLGENAIGPCAPALGLWVRDPNGALTQLSTPCDSPPAPADRPVRELWEWSPVANELAYVRVDGSDDDLFVIDATTGARTLVATGEMRLPYPVESDSIAWSPDGSRIAYVEGNAVYAVEVATGQRSLLSDSFDQIIDLAWSPDGTQIFVQDQERNRIQVMNADGSDLHALVEGTDACCETAWSPNGDRIVYMLSLVDGEGWHSEVWTNTPDGLNPIQVASLSGCAVATDSLPVWANETQVAYLGCDGWVVENADGTGDPQPTDQLHWRSWYGGGLVGGDLALLGEANR